MNSAEPWRSSEHENAREDGCDRACIEFTAFSQPLARNIRNKPTSAIWISSNFVSGTSSLVWLVANRLEYCVAYKPLALLLVALTWMAVQNSAGLCQASVQAEQRQTAPATTSPPTPDAGSYENAAAAKDQSPETAGQPESKNNTARAELQSLVQNSINKEPTLSGSSITVLVTDVAIELSGMVSSGRQRLTAARIAQSYAGSRRVVNYIQVATDREEPSKKDTDNDEPDL